MSIMKLEDNQLKFLTSSICMRSCVHEGKIQLFSILFIIWLSILGFSIICSYTGHTVNDNSYWKGLYLLKLRFLIAFKLPTRRKTRNTTYKLPTVENFSIRVFKDTVSSHAMIFIHHLFIYWTQLNI